MGALALLMQPEAEWLQDPAFLQAQEEDPPLTAPQQGITVNEGQVSNAWKAGHLPRVKRIQGLWWRVVPLSLGNAKGHQLIISVAYWPQVLNVAHDSTWAGYQDPRKTAS